MDTVTGNSFLGTIENKVGEQLYLENCAGCHKNPPDTRTSGANFDEIKAAILVVTPMQFIDLEDNEIQSIADYLEELTGGQAGNNGGGAVVGNPGSGPYVPPSPQHLQRADAFGESGVQRLTKKQLLRTLEQNLGVNLASLSGNIPFDSDSSTHFSNDYNLLSISYPGTVEYSALAEKAAKSYTQSRFVQDIGCTPSAPRDKTCFDSFLSKMGRRFFRRPLSSAEIKRFSDLLLDYAQEDSRFMTAVEMALEAMVQHPEFLYRIESGTSQAAPQGLVRLSSYEVASRLAFLITGRGPDDQILDAAAAGQLNSAAGRVSYVEDMLKSGKAKENWQDFHGQWLGYGEIVSSHALKNDFQLESDKLIEEINFVEKSDWLNIFSEQKTYLTPALANHYGIAGVNQSRWVATTGQRASGILTHAAFAAVGSKFGDTSPTLRGYEIFKRVFCGKLTGNVPANVDVTQAPGNPNDCKPERYSMRYLNSCAGCHSATDGIGFGLEGIDQFGRLRNVEVGNNQCTIDGKGDFQGQAFTGPNEFAQLVAGNPIVGACATENLFEYMMGRSATSEDQPVLKALEGEYYQTRSLQGILKSIVSSEAMVHRKEL